MTTYVLDSATVTRSSGRRAFTGQLGAVGVGAGWRCLVVGGDAAVAGWFRARVGVTGSVLVTDFDYPGGSGLATGGLTVGLVDPATDRLPSGFFDVVHVRLGGVAPLDRRRALENLVASVRAGGWIVVEEVVDLPFELPAGDTAVSSLDLAAAISRVAAEREAELEWARRVPDLLLARGCTEVTRQGLCAAGGAISAAVNLPDRGAGPEVGGAGSGSFGEVPVELEPFRWLLVDPYQGRPVDAGRAGMAHVVFSTAARH